jgi:hypothetical protein
MRRLHGEGVHGRIQQRSMRCIVSIELSCPFSLTAIHGHASHKMAGPKMASMTCLRTLSCVYLLTLKKTFFTCPDFGFFLLSQGPNCVVLDFHIYVCMTCSGIHREFQHKCKGISMSKVRVHRIAVFCMQSIPSHVYLFMCTLICKAPWRA